MLITHTRILNVPIVSLQTGAPLGQATEPIIDPRQLHIIAFRCSGARVQGRPILHTSDIREVSNIGLIVDSADSLMPPDDLVRLQTVTNLKFVLLGKRVVNTRGRKLGRVEGYSVDVNSFYIMKLTVGQSIVRNFWGGSLLIDRTQIIKITNKEVVVQSTEVKERPAPAKPIIENPFRHTQRHPQPDGSSVNTTRE